MLIQIKEFATIRISSHDVAQSKDWYRKLFGVQPIEDQKQFASFKIAGTYFDISQADSKSPSSPGGGVGYWLVNDLDQVIQHAISLGGKVYRGPLDVKETGRTIVQILDPIGNVMGFEAITPRAES